MPRAGRTGWTEPLFSAADKPPGMDLLVVGAGEMGRWLARALDEDADVPVAVTFHDADPAAAEAAAEGCEATSTEDPDAGHDAVCIAVPIPAAAEAIARFAPLAEGAVFDVTGTMATPLAAMADHAADREQCSLHPLFAPANEPGSVAAVLAERGPTTATVLEALEARGNDVFETTAGEHDRAMETVQARAHTAVLAYGLAAEAVDERFHTPVSSGLEGLLEQVTDGESRVYADIQDAFDGADDVAAAASDLAAADHDRFADLFDEAGR